jgi:hypothetical protein
MMNVHGVAATLAAVSGLVLLGDKPGWAAFLVAAVAIEALTVLRRFTRRDRSADSPSSQAPPGLYRRGDVSRRLWRPRLGQNPFVRQNDGGSGDDVGDGRARGDGAVFAPRVPV